MNSIVIENANDNANNDSGLNINRKIQYLLDKSSPYVLYRWIVYILLLLGYFYRVYTINGFFIITYALGIYLLNQFIGFLTPQVSLYYKL